MSDISVSACYILLKWCLFECCGNCVYFLIERLEEDVAGVNEEVEFVDQEEQEQGQFVEQGKLPSILHYMLLISKQALHTKVFEKLKPFHLSVKSYFATLYKSS